MSGPPLLGEGDLWQTLAAPPGTLLSNLGSLAGTLTGL